MDGYIEDVKFCDYCGSFLTEEGRCPDEECVFNLLLDVMAELDAEIQKEKEQSKPVAEEDTTPTEEGESAADDAEVIEESSETASVEEQTKDVEPKEEP